MAEKILTLHPDPQKRGVNISREKYDAMRAAILESLKTHGSQTFAELWQRVEEQLEGNFEGAIGWYYTTVKLDLEARGEIARQPNTSPQVVRIIQ